MTAPVRELQLFADTRLYVSDVGAIVIEQSAGDVEVVYFEPDRIDELIAGLRALKASAQARQSMAESLLVAQYEAWIAGGGA